MNDLQDKQLWHIAKRRAAFKRSLIAYIIVNSFLWCIFLINKEYDIYPWPVWPMLGWGIGLAFQYFGAYHRHNLFSVEKEYEKLKNKSQDTNISDQ